MSPLTDEELAVPREPEKRVALPPEKKEEMRTILGRILFVAFYNKEEHPDNFLSFPEQDYFIKKTVELAYEHSDDPDVLMSRAYGYAVRYPEEIERIRTIISLGRKEFLTNEDRLLFERSQKWRLLSDDEKNVINDRIKEIGAQYLDHEKKDLFLTYCNNKLRRAWFTGTLGIIRRLAYFNFFDRHREDDLIARVDALYRTVIQQSMNTHENVVEGDALIQEALAQLFPSIKGLGPDERKKELQTLLGIKETE